jgi:uncharacterized membrane protein YqjE
VDYRGRTSAGLEEESSGRSITDMVKDIGAGIRDIVRSEIKLAKVEIADTAGRVRSASMMLASGGILGIFAIGFILLAAMFALEIVLPAWAAALILGVVLFVGAAIGIAGGRARLKTIRGPQKTMQTVKEDLQWIKEQARS